ncbi:serine/arginine repetitive matrix protein 1-like [Procambarus clarkii]|uniref:serine/arginine repetitive matrix protein 1-like n=1 Tax=Procambarus clarkii TaxID=6728 RepID=UPI0037431062
MHIMLLYESHIHTLLLQNIQQAQLDPKSIQTQNIQGCTNYRGRHRDNLRTPPTRRDTQAALHPGPQGDHNEHRQSPYPAPRTSPLLDPQSPHQPEQGPKTPDTRGAPEEPDAGGPKAEAARTHTAATSTAWGHSLPPRPETGAEGAGPESGRAHSSSQGASTTDAEAIAADEPLDKATFVDDEGVDSESEGREEDTPHHPSIPGSRKSSAGEAGTTPTAAAEDRTEASGRGCTSATTERGTPEVGAPVPTEHTGEADVLCPDQTGTEGALAEPAAGTTPGTSPGRESDEEAPRVFKGEKSPSKKTEGASARGASQLAATLPLSTTPETSASLSLIEYSEREPTIQKTRRYR